MHSIFLSVCTASLTRLVRFAKNYSIIEGTPDVTWDYYSLDLIRYAVPAHRCSCLFKIVHPSTKKDLPSRMINADTHGFNGYSVEEITGGIICGCLPALPAFIRHVSDMKIRLMKAFPDSSQSKFTSRRSNTKQPAPTSLSSPPKFAALSPTARNSPVYTTTKAISPVTTRWTDGKGVLNDQWDELDELEYVAGDEERYEAEERSTV